MRFEVDFAVVITANYADYRLCEAIKGGLFFRLICTFFKGVSGLVHSIVKSMATVLFWPRNYMEIASCIVIIFTAVDQKLMGIDCFTHIDRISMCGGIKI